MYALIHSLTARNRRGRVAVAKAAAAGRFGVVERPLVIFIRRSAVLGICLLAILPAAAQGRSAHARAAASGAGAGGICTVRTLPSFIDQGEGPLAGSIADIVDVKCNPELYGSGQPVKLSAHQLFSRCGEHLVWSAPSPVKFVSGPTFTVTLDSDGNARAVLWAGPGCQAGESLIAAHLMETPHETVTTVFSVLPPARTPPGLTALPPHQVEDDVFSSVATIVEVEFPAKYAEKFVHISAEELFASCGNAPHLIWVGAGATVLNPEEQGGDLAKGAAFGPLLGLEAVSKVQLDNEGNAFVVVLGDSSCASGTTLIEADLESTPFTTYTTTFTVEPPQPTFEEPGFGIEKLQRVAGSGGSFTKSPLTGEIGQTVEYEMVVHNTGNVPERLSGFTDPHCDAGTIAGGPGETPVAVGASTTYTCSHVLTAVGSYTNEALVTGTPPSGIPATHNSNQVVVTVPPRPEFTIEKLQRVKGVATAYTTTQVVGTIGQTVEYEIVIKNTGNVPLTFGPLSDPHCDAGTISGGPGAAPLAVGAQTTYTCSHVLTALGSYINEATLTGAGPGEEPFTHTSPPVEALVQHAAFVIEKLQRLGASSAFTSSPLTGAIGQTVQYEIIVKNTGEVPLTFASFSDPHCDAGTLAGGPGEAAVAPGGETTYTCSHVLTSAGTFVNEATVTGTPPHEPAFPLTSNKVEVTVPAPASGSAPAAQSTPAPGKEKGQHEVKGVCETSIPTIHGAAGPKRRPFTVSLSAAGVSRVVFYLDARKVKTVSSAQASHGMFVLKVYPERLSYGSHKLTARVTFANGLCAGAARSSTFIRPRARTVAVKFTG